MSKFNIGDTVYLLPNAHASENAAGRTPELFLAQLERYGAVAYDSAFIVVEEEDEDGDVRVEVGESDFYVLAKFLVPWVEEEKPVEHMVLGKTYKHSQSHLYYRADALDSGNSLVYFTFGHEPDVGQNLSSNRRFVDIEEEFGVLPPVKPETDKALEDLREKLQKPVEELVARVDIDSWDASPDAEPKLISEAALREAMDYLGIQEVFDTENIISLAKRLEK